MSVIDMQDRELLELAAKAAKAAGIEVRWTDQDVYRGSFLRRVAPKPEEPCSEWLYWRPLTDDGDALRLAVTLGIKFRWHAVLNQALAWPCSLERLAEVAENGEDYKGDIFAAARRAITRAAAEIGRSMPC